MFKAAYLVNHVVDHGNCRATNQNTLTNSFQRKAVNYRCLSSWPGYRVTKPQTIKRMPVTSIRRSLPTFYPYFPTLTYNHITLIIGLFVKSYARPVLAIHYFTVGRRLLKRRYRCLRFVYVIFRKDSPCATSLCGCIHSQFVNGVRRAR